MNNDNNRRGGYYSELTGFRRAVPVILVALAVFCGVCFITSGTGILGDTIGATLLGLFGAGAYAIPVLLVLHAVFYPVDYAKKLTASRAVFSLITVVIVSAVQYTVIYYGNEPVFAPGEFYASQSAGGFVGSIIAFGIVKILGNVGLWILSAAVIAIYIAFFFTRGDGAYSRAVLAIVEAVARALAAVEKKIHDMREASREARAERERQDEERRSLELMDDQFFAADNSMQELNISELGIHESRSEETIEQNPTLLSKVHHRSVIEESEVTARNYIEAPAEASTAPIVAEDVQRKPVNLSYGLDGDMLIESVAEEISEEAPEETEAKTAKDARNPFTYGDSADSVFTKDFEPFDFSVSEKMSHRPSSKVQPKVEAEGISEVTTPISAITEEDMINHRRALENQRRREEFERRKREIVGNARAHAPAAEPEAAPDVRPERIETVSEDELMTPAAKRAAAKTVEFNVAKAASTASPVVSDAMTIVFNKPDFPMDETDHAAARIAEVVEKNVPGYARSANRSYTYTKVTIPEEAAKPAEAETATVANEAVAFDFVNEGEGAPIAEAVSEPVYSAPVAEAASEPVYSAPAAEAVSEPVYSAPAAEAVSEPAYSTPAAEAVNEPVYSAPVADAVSEPVYSVPAAEAVSEPVYSSPVAEAVSEPVYSAPATEAVSEPVYSAPAAEAVSEPTYNKIINEYSTAPAESSDESIEEFKPYEPEIAAAPVSEVTEELKVERTLLSPTPERVYSSAEAARDSRYTVIDANIPVEDEGAEPEEPEDTIDWSKGQTESAPDTAEKISVDTGTVFEFEDGSNGDEVEELSVPDDESAIFGMPEEDEEISDGDEPQEIPPEEQNPVVMAQREMFPFLAREAEEAVSENENSASADPVVNVADAPKEIKEDAESEADGDKEDVLDNVDIPDADDYGDSFDEQIADEADVPPFDMDEDIPALSGLELVPAKPQKEEKPKPPKPDYSNYEFPSLELLGFEEEDEDEDIDVEIQENADKLIETLSSFDVTASIKGVDRGPRITRYEVVPAKGIKVSKVMNLQDDIALSLAAGDIRMEAPIPGKSAIGVEIPNKNATTVRLRELLECEEFQSQKSKTAVCIGKDVAGAPVFGDIAKMPHLLIAGATGMGKSVSINALLISMLYKARPDEVKLIMIDPKQVEFTLYDGIPHLLVPVVSDPKQAAGSLMWAVEEMNRRYELIRDQLVRNIDAYNAKVTEDPSLGEPLPKIVIVIDEFADLMLQVRDPVESLVMSIAQKARAAGIHLIVGTQRPSVNVITGTIKANIPSRMSCKVSSNVDSRTILETAGAEKLLNRGDMLYAFAGAIKPIRVQGAFVSDSEVESVMTHLKKFSNGQSYDESVMEEIKRAADKCNKKGSSGGGDYDDGDEGGSEGYLNDRQFLDAVEVAVNSGKISTSLLQRRLSIGYGKAAKFIDVMCDMGIVGEPNGQRPRDVLITPDEWREKLARTMLD